MVDPIAFNSMHGMALLPVPGANPITPMQTEMDLQIQKSAEIDGIFMGVLTDGTRPGKLLKPLSLDLGGRDPKNNPDFLANDTLRRDL